MQQFQYHLTKKLKLRKEMINVLRIVEMYKNLALIILKNR